MSDVRLAEDDEEVALAGVLEVVRHVEIGVHAGFEHGNPAHFVELRRMGLIIERAGDQHVKAAVGGLAHGFHKIRAGHGAEFRADEDGGAPRGPCVRIAFGIGPFRAHIFAGPRFEDRKVDAIFLVCLLNAGAFEMVEDHRDEVLRFAVPSSAFCCLVDEFVVFIDAKQAVRRHALHRKGSGDAHLFLVLVGSVVQVFVVGLGSNGSVDFLLPGDAQFPPVRMDPLDTLVPMIVGFAGDLPFHILLRRRRSLLLFRLRNRRDEIGPSATVGDFSGRLVVLVQLPVATGDIHRASSAPAA